MAAAPAAVSVHSLPISPQWPGIHCKIIFLYAWSRFLRTIARPLPSLLPEPQSAVSAAWLSEHMTVRHPYPWSANHSVANSSAITSISNDDVNELPFLDEECTMVGSDAGPVVAIAELPAFLNPLSANPSV